MSRLHARDEWTANGLCDLLANDDGIGQGYVLLVMENDTATNSGVIDGCASLRGMLQEGPENNMLAGPCRSDAGTLGVTEGTEDDTKSNCRR